MAPAATAGNRTGASSSLSNVVSSLVRAQYGLASQEKPDQSNETDLDRHVAELLLQEAKEREERSKRENQSSWRLSDDEDQPQYQTKTNKRFLKNIIRGVEDHNEALRQQKRQEDLDAIRKREREERERRRAAKDGRSFDAPTQRPDVGETNTGNPTASRRSGAPGFAARTLAIGLSGAIGARQEQDKRRKDLNDAVEQARSRASSKDKERAYDDALEERSERTRERTDRREQRNDENGSRTQSSSRYDRHESSRSSHLERESETDSRRTHRRSRSVERNRGERSSRRDKRSRRSESPDSSRPSHRRSDERGPTTERRRKRSASTASASSVVSSDSEEAFVDVTNLGDGRGAGTGSKMDKYFSSNYNPAADVNFADLEDKETGLIAEGNFSEWDRMLSVLKKRKEDKAFGVTRAREEERDRQLRKLERKKRREEKEARRALRKQKKRSKRHDSDDDDSDTSVGPKPRDASPPVPKTVVLDGFTYGKKGSVRAWDLGKDAIN